MMTETNPFEGKGYLLTGTSRVRDRVKNDYYSTPKESTLALLDKEEIIYPAWEPARGNGAIARLLSEPTLKSDIVDRGYGEIYDFFEFNTRGVATIITNPPFSLFQKFAEHALELAERKVILFGKLQVLEGNKRATFLENSPLRTVYVFKKRQNPLRNGLSVDENGKSWSGTMAFAWFVWEKGYAGKPQIEWL
jgi:hypothetical protein